MSEEYNLQRKEYQIRKESKSIKRGIRLLKDENKEKRTITTPLGSRYVFSARAVSRLPCSIEEMQNAIDEQENSNWLRSLVTVGGSYKTKPMTDEQGDYMYVYNRGETQRLPIIPVDIHADTDEEGYTMDLTNNIFSSSSARKSPNNTKTRELKLNEIIGNILEERDKKI